MHTAFRDPGIPDGEKSVYTVTVADRPPKLDLISVVTHDGDGYRSILEAGLGPRHFAMTMISGSGAAEIGCRPSTIARRHDRAPRWSPARKRTS
ncbi:hypothetical protein [Nocardia asiatica]|uniref:hypothetical protein n=1 Tax=Nocardia asiatica TaxID=209252 RepID=UPI003EDE99C5